MEKIFPIFKLNSFSGKQNQFFFTSAILTLAYFLYGAAKQFLNISTFLSQIVFLKGDFIFREAIHRDSLLKV